MPTLVSIYDAKAQLSRLIDRAAAGADIVIGRAGQPIIRMVPVESALPRQPGLLKGLTVPEALFAPLPDDEQTHWE
jgi:prevent-host-death family protein